MNQTTSKHLIALGLSGLLLASCSPGDSRDSASSSQSEEPQSQVASKSTESSSTEETSTSSSTEKSSMPEKAESESADDLPTQLQMDSEFVWLPSFFPEGTAPVSSEIVTNEPDEYDVLYMSEDSSRQVEVAGRIYPTQEAALQNIEETVNGSVSVPDNEEMSYDLGYGITGYIEGAAGNSYLGWQEGNWTFTIHSRLQDEWDVQGIAEKIVEHLESKFLPAPSQRGTVYINYSDKDTDPHIQILWNNDNRVYEVNTVQTPIDAIDIITSME